MSPYLGIVVAVVLVLDQATKWLIRANFHPYETRQILGDVFHLTFYQNTGMAFGLLEGYSGVIAVFSVFAIGFLIYFSRRFRKEKIILASLGLVIGGALGNLVDRIVLTGVVDFLDFGFGKYRWPAFNVADICISVGIGLLVLYSARPPEPGDDRP
ncbi:signal peptidase II [bacterium]|nr:signal peptidase II [bacterium]